MIKKLFASQLRLNMFSGMTTTVINTIVMAAGYPIYLHFLGYEEYGVWLVLTTVLTFALLGNFGISPALIKLVAEDYGRGDIDGVCRYISTALALLSISGTIILALILIFKFQIIALFRLGDENAKIALWLIPYVGALSIYVFIMQVFYGALSGLGRMDLSNYIQCLGRFITVGVAAILLYMGWGVRSMLIATVSSYLFNHLVCFICIRRIIRIRLLKIGRIDIHRCSRLLRFGSGVLGSTMLDMLLSPFNKLILSRYVGVSSVPIYDMAYTGSMQIRGLAEVGLRALMPEVSRIAGNMTSFAKDRISHIFHRAIKLVFICGVPLYGGLIILLTPLLKLWLRHEFVDELPLPFRIMLIVAFVSLLGVPAYYTLLGLGMVRKTLTSHIILSGVSSFIVLLMVVVQISISVERISLCIITATVLSTLYLNWQVSKIVFKTGV
jgi:O-antigen/teichoic acid export membrane protein